MELGVGTWGIGDRLSVIGVNGGSQTRLKQGSSLSVPGGLCVKAIHFTPRRKERKGSKIETVTITGSEYG